MSAAEDVLEDGLLVVFTSELLNQWKLANIAAEHVNWILGKSGKFDSDIFWYHVENLVKALVAMTNILWTSNNKSRHKRRSRLLRKRFGLSDEIAPSDLRETRNWFEHFDEKIDDWWDSSTDKNLADRNVMPKSAIQGLELSGYARFFDPETFELSVFGRSVDLLQLHAKMASIVEQVEATAKVHPRLHHLIRHAP